MNNTAHIIDETSNEKPQVKSHKSPPNHMSFLTSLISLAIFLFSYVSPTYGRELRSIGLFALSGAITNWLAIHMLFEKVPGFYGSGVIALRFQDFKLGIKSLIQEQFFTEKNIKQFLDKNNDDNKGKNEISKLIQELDFDSLFQKLLQGIQSSPLGGMLQMVGGTQVLEPAKGAIIETLKKEILEYTDSPTFKEKASSLVNNRLNPKDISQVIDQKLSEMTPNMVKNIIQKMIRKHLGWLVVWGGILGGLLGLIAEMAL